MPAPMPSLQFVGLPKPHAVLQPCPLRCHYSQMGTTVWVRYSRGTLVYLQKVPQPMHHATQDPIRIKEACKTLIGCFVSANFGGSHGCRWPRVA